MNLSNYQEKKPHRTKRIVWAIVNMTIFMFAIGRVGWPVRKFLLKLFGAVIAKDAYVYSSSKIFAPWFLTVGRACIGPSTQIYNKTAIKIGNDSVISQGAFLCTASHDISSIMLPLKTAEISIGDNVWVAADAFIGPGVSLKNGVVVGARAVVVKSVEPWTVIGGNPAKFIKKREIL